MAPAQLRSKIDRMNDRSSNRGRSSADTRISAIPRETKERRRWADNEAIYSAATDANVQRVSAWHGDGFRVRRRAIHVLDRDRDIENPICLFRFNIYRLVPEPCRLHPGYSLQDSPLPRTP
ncbi:hypothetical protein J6590_021090 [Homalodisca vitripennis]|nr:hypothetical protein J6590_021090 [Homalodisca vitripennis]